MSLLNHAKQELDLAFPAGNEMNDLMREQILEMVQLFSTHGHSGFSASYAVLILERLLRFKPLLPLTGADDEWNEVGNGVYQNRRSSNIFKDETGAYNIDGHVFCEQNGVCYTNRESRVYITFPYTPKTEYVDVAESE